MNKIKKKIYLHLLQKDFKPGSFWDNVLKNLNLEVNQEMSSRGSSFTFKNIAKNKKISFIQYLLKNNDNE